MVLVDFLDAHARRQEFQEVLDGVAQPSHRGLTLTDRRGGGDAVRRDIHAIVPRHIA